MPREVLRFSVPLLAREVDVAVSGQGPVPLLCFPTSLGAATELEQQQFLPMDSAYTLFCVSTIDRDALLDCASSPRQRIERHSAYESALVHQLAPMIQARSGRSTFAVCGAGLGGYQAFNFAMRHPDLVHSCTTFGAPFDIRGFFRGYFDEDVYFHNPVEYLPNLTDSWFLDRYRNMRIVFATGESDLYLGENQRISGILNGKAISHWLDIWGNGAGHDWLWWRQMARKHFN
jgi:esterase/lipase superfamily enzyme